MKKRLELIEVYKSFQINSNEKKGILRQIIDLISSKKPTRKKQILKNINFTVYEGQIVGIIGKNGSGKSSLLRIIAGIYTADTGIVTTNGKIISLIRLSAGLKDTLTVEENLHLCCSLIGLSRSETSKRKKDIISYAGLENYSKAKKSQISNGMVERLVFSIAIHSNPSILLLDEVFEVGDELFKQKAQKTLKNMASKGCSIIFVSHDLQMVQDNCDICYYFDKKTLHKKSNKEKTIQAYKLYMTNESHKI